MKCCVLADRFDCYTSQWHNVMTHIKITCSVMWHHAVLRVRSSVSGKHALWFSYREGEIATYLPGCTISHPCRRHRHRRESFGAYRSKLNSRKETISFLVYDIFLGITLWKVKNSKLRVIRLFFYVVNVNFSKQEKTDVLGILKQGSEDNIWT
jgi:hypothetical protein